MAIGVVKRQGIKMSLVAYAGVALGAITTLLIYPYCLSEAEIGLIRVLMDVSMLLAPFFQIGFIPVLIRYFPHYNKSANKRHNFYGNLLLLLLAGSVVGTLILAIFYPQIKAYYSLQNPLLATWLPVVLPITWLFSLYTAASAYSNAMLRIVVPALLRNIVLRLLLITIIILYYFKVINLGGLVWGIAIMYIILLMLVMYYIYRLDGVKLLLNTTTISPKMWREILAYASYVILASVAGMMVTRIDVIALATFDTLTNTGIYTIAMFMGSVIEMPKRALTNITHPILAQAWVNNNVKQLSFLYKESALQLMLVGSFVLIGVWSNVDNLFALIPNGQSYQAGKYVVLFIGLAKWIDMSTGVNNEIITTSPFYKYQLLITISLAVTTILTNYWLIPLYGINGAALASLLTFTLYNLGKMLVIYIHTKMQPFSKPMAKIILLSLLTFGVQHLLPQLNIIILDILLRSLLISIIFISGTILLNISTEVNSLLQTILKRFKS